MHNKLLFSIIGSTLCCTPIYSQVKPNIIVIYTDDMGLGDLSCYNSGWVSTPNIDKLASQGLKFNNYYTSSPVSSPSRVGLTTGMFPIEWGINTFLSSKKANKNCEQSNYLSPEAPTIAKSLKAIGYSTAHIGKWHMGGGRDVDDAPKIPLYGFDEYLSTYESPNPDPLITSSNWIWNRNDSIQRWERTSYFVDKTLDFLSRHKGEPCFINLWPDDMHDPWIPSYGYYNIPESWTSRDNFIAVLTQYDKEIGRLIKGIENLGLRENTIIIFSSDNGALPTFDNARSNGHKGSKNSLYEGGIKLPFIISWPGVIKEGTVDNETIISAVDIYPSLCSITGAKVIEGFEYSGEDMSQALLGKTTLKRTKDLMWDFGRNKYFNRPPKKNQRSPHLCIRRGDWKLLVDSNGKNTELYNIEIDPNETTNIASKYPELTSELKEKVINWYLSKRVLNPNNSQNEK